VDPQGGTPGRDIEKTVLPLLASQQQICTRLSVKRRRFQEQKRRSPRVEVQEDDVIEGTLSPK